MQKRTVQITEGQWTIRYNVKHISLIGTSFTKDCRTAHVFEEDGRLEPCPLRGGCRDETSCSKKVGLISCRCRPRFDTQPMLSGKSAVDKSCAPILPASSEVIFRSLEAPSALGVFLITRDLLWCLLRLRDEDLVIRPRSKERGAFVLNEFGPDFEYPIEEV